MLGFIGSVSFQVHSDQRIDAKADGMQMPKQSVKPVSSNVLQNAFGLLYPEDSIEMNKKKRAPSYQQLF
jgi:hypothetical protein